MIVKLLSVVRLETFPKHFKLLIFGYKSRFLFSLILNSRLLFLKEDDAL